MNDKYIWQDNVLGNLVYEKTDWRKEKPIQVYYNSKMIEINVYVRVLDSIYTEYFFGIGDNEIGWTDEDFEEDKEDDEEYYNNVKLIYQQYIGNVQYTINKVEEIIFEEYNLYTNNKLERQEVLKQTSLKKITIFDDRLEIECICKWNVMGTLGIVMYKDFSIVTGGVEILY